MHRVGIKPSQIHEYMVERASGYRQVGYTRSNIQNSLACLRWKKLQDTDAESYIAYLQGKKSNDEAFYFEYTIENENRLGDIFLCDGGLRADYTLFGDAIAFDETYRTNAYNKPFVVILGINHHRRTTVFGFAQLSSETKYTYTWLLETFLNVMDGKHQQTVITDGDREMRKAISQTFHWTVHRLCCKHLKRNAQSNVGSTSFTADFKDCMLYTFSTEELERKWEIMVRKHKVEANEWVKKMYEDKHSWLEAYLKGHFF